MSFAQIEAEWGKLKMNRESFSKCDPRGAAVQQ
jgi:hypothetical protein